MKQCKRKRMPVGCEEISFYSRVTALVAWQRRDKILAMDPMIPKRSSNELMNCALFNFAGMNAVGSRFAA